MSYSGLGLTAAQANADLGWSKRKIKKYWDARAKACQQMGDEGVCLAQIAKHVPVTLGGLGSTEQDIATIATVTAGMFSNPDRTLARYGPPIVAAADKHIVTPIAEKMPEILTPYLIKYVLPPVAVLYVLSGVSAYYSYKSVKGKKVTPNRRRKNRRRRRTSRR